MNYEFKSAMMKGWTANEKGVTYGSDFYAYENIISFEVSIDTLSPLTNGVIEMVIPGKMLPINLAYPYKKKAEAKEAVAFVQRKIAGTSLDNNECPIQINDIRIGHQDPTSLLLGWRSGCDAAGGISVRFDLLNTTGKTLKYVLVLFTPYNSVKDKVKCAITGKSTNAVNITGPILPGGTVKAGLFENAWYNRTIVRVDVDLIMWEYADQNDEEVHCKALTEIGQKLMNEDKEASPEEIMKILFGDDYVDDEDEDEEESANEPEIGDVSEQLRQLKELLDEGLISEADYEAKKKQVLGI